jgi:hypothetical protein
MRFGLALGQGAIDLHNRLALVPVQCYVSLTPVPELHPFECAAFEEAGVFMSLRHEIFADEAWTHGTPPRIDPLPDTPWQKPEQLSLFDPSSASPTTAKTSPDTRGHLRLIKGGLS